ncbi:hypothetical protein SteCoe_5662 [Stentor coeruleus]|uniref:non-specific serine/threonine protein kinase n=1 Tax=Stentor coeruleus TaxID=5963 RepID=A0A1R2CRX7_9CILI|nr:hypothetical protein SteCoe_5662 [Stentor coeruleus]
MGCGLFKSKSEHSKTLYQRKTNISLTPAIFLRACSMPNLEFYTFIKTIGKGTFSEVYLTEYFPIGQKRALKSIKKLPLTSSQLSEEYKVAEMQILRQLDHPNIIKCFEIFEDCDNFYLALEYCEGGSLMKKLKENVVFTEKQAAEIIDQILSGVAYIHQKNLIHRDLKLENILLQSNEELDVKIADFGSASVQDLEKGNRGVYGTDYYLAPEVLNEMYNEKSDIWSCGIILCCLVTGLPPYSGKNSKDVRKQIVANPFQANTQTLPKKTLLLVDFASKLLEINSNDRISAKKALEHPWLLLNRKKKSDSSFLCINYNTFSKNKLVQGVLMYIITCLVKSKNLSSLSEAFREIDNNRNGKIEKEELESELRKTHPYKKSQEITEKIFEEYDLNQSNAIEFTEFLMAFEDHKHLLSQNLIIAAFERFDKDHDGKIFLNDIEKLIGPIDINDEENIIVRNNLGLGKAIDRNEFIELINKLMC